MTSAVVADVFFSYPEPTKVQSYQAYIGSLTSPKRCSRPGASPPYKCAIRDLEEATEYTIVARVCLNNKPDCEPPIEAIARTKPRGSYTLYSPTNVVWQAGWWIIFTLKRCFTFISKPVYQNQILQTVIFTKQLLFVRAIFILNYSYLHISNLRSSYLHISISFALLKRMLFVIR